MSVWCTLTKGHVVDLSSFFRNVTLVTSMQSISTEYHALFKWCVVDESAEGGHMGPRASLCFRFAVVCLFFVAETFVYRNALLVFTVKSVFTFLSLSLVHP